MADEWSIVDNFLGPLAGLAALLVIILGVMWLIYASYEANRRKSWRKLTGIDDWKFDVTAFLKVLSLLGYIVGIFSIICGAAGLILDLPPSIAYKTVTADEANVYVSVFLIILGLLTFMKPMNDLPIASIIGFAISTIITVAILAGLMYLGVNISSTIAIILIVVFLVVFGIVGVIVKVYTDGLMLLSKIISFPPFAIILFLFCIVYGGALLIFGISLI